MADEHSKLLSPSSMARILACPGSVKASENIPDRDTSFSLEGTDAHELASVRVHQALGEKIDFNPKILSFYSVEMEDYISEYVSYFLEKLEEVKKHCKDPIVLIEQRVAAPDIDESLHGTTDISIIADKKLTIIDLKYGKGNPVVAENNEQEMSYAVCCLETFGHLYDVENVELCIYQPRLSNVSEWNLSVTDLYNWVDSVLKPGIKKVRDGVEEFHPSKHCSFCKAKPLCKALRDKNMELAKHEFRPPFLMDDSEVEDVLDKAENLINWINSVKDFALEHAITGTRYEKYKLVEGRSTRKFTDEFEVAKVIKGAGYNPYESKLLTLTAMQAMLGKTKFEELLKNLIIKQNGKLTLVSRTDKRPEVTSAANDFKNEK